MTLYGATTALQVLAAALAVLTPLQAGNLETAQVMLARMVSRDTKGLTEPELVRGTIESVAENSSDGVIAPLFYMAIGGVPLALAYKAINTLDSMLGYRTEQYEYFGKVAARVDDVANFLPARLPNPVQDAGILPGVDERAVNRLLVGKHILKRLEKVTTLAFEHRRKERRHAEDLRRFGEAYHVVDDRLCVMTAQAGELECLMVNQEQHAVIGREQGFEAVF